MSYERSIAQRVCKALLAILIGAACAGPRLHAQPAEGEPVHFRIDGPSQRLEMIVNTSRILTLPHKVPEMLVNNPQIVRATPLSPNQIQVSALRPGVTQLNLWDENKNVYSVDLIVFGDARELQSVLKSAFPEARLQVRPLSSSVMISGYVPNADMVTRVVSMAEDYYPRVINNMTIGGVQQVLLHVQVMEVSRTKLRKLGVDWLSVDLSDPRNFGVSRVSGLLSDFLTEDDLIVRNGSETIAAGVVSGDSGFFALIEALRQYNLAKVMAQPTLVTLSGRPASFNSGGEIPIPVPSGLGTVAIQYRQFGTRIDFVPIVLGNGSIRLEVRPQVSDVDPGRSVTTNNLSVPGFRTRWADTAVEMKAGQTLALAGLIQTRTEAENRGIPYLADLPWIGAAFRRVEHRENEVELLIMVTPELVDPIDAHEAPPCGPGQLTTAPGDTDLYWRGYMEVPRCCPDGQCLHCQQHQGGEVHLLGPEGEILPAGPPHGSPAGPPAVPDVNAASGPDRMTEPARTARMPQNQRRGVPSGPNGARHHVGDIEPALIGPIGYDVVE